MHRQRQENYTSNIQADLFYKTVGEEQQNQERKKALSMRLSIFISSPELGSNNNVLYMVPSVTVG